MLSIHAATAAVFLDFVTKHCCEQTTD